MDRPSGKKVVLTREPEDNRELARTLHQRGVEVLEIPCLITELVRPERLPAEPAGAAAFTSRRAVRGVYQQGLWEKLVPAGAPRPLVGAVGEATAGELRRVGVEADLVAVPAEGKVLAGMMLERLKPRSSVLLPRGNLRAGQLDRMLAEAGHILFPLVVYRNSEPRLPALDPFSAVVFVASPSAARRLLARYPWMAGAAFFTIGATTAAALAALGVDRIERMGVNPHGWVETLWRAAVEQEGA